MKSRRFCIVSSMTDSYRYYLKELKSELGFYPAWLPTSPLELGAFGVFKDGFFQRQGSLTDLKIGFTEKVDPTGNPILKRRGMRFGARAAVNATPLSVRPSQTRAFIFPALSRLTTWSVLVMEAFIFSSPV